MKLKLMGKFLQIVTGGNVLAITLCPFGIYFRDKESLNNKRTINHESIHWKQQLEMIFVGTIISLITAIILLIVKSSLWMIIPIVLFPFLLFYIWYLIEWIIRIFVNGKQAYISISFEQEAYDNAENMSYLQTRKHFTWFKYIFKNIWK